MKNLRKIIPANNVLVTIEGSKLERVQGGGKTIKDMQDGAGNSGDKSSGGQWWR
jgi:hypothetical protein